MSKPFTDNDLDRLKDAIAILGGIKATFSSDFKIPSLIARLEAAEEGFMAYHGEEISKGCSCRVCTKWRKVCGK